MKRIKVYTGGNASRASTVVTVMRSLRERFEEKVDRTGTCHEWNAATDKNTGYGQFKVGGVSRGAHVVALELKLGRPLLPGMQALHTCDNPPCVNEDHLYEGTPLDNIHDAIERGSHVPPPPGSNPPIHMGEDNNNAVMTEERVRELRELYATGEWTYARLVLRYGISKATVSQIVRRVTWKEVA